MEEAQTSDSVAVLPDISEPLTSETEDASALASEHEAHPVAVATAPGVASVPGVGVPVSLPVGSIIGVTNPSNCTTFNVITSDQLQVLNIFHRPLSLFLIIYLILLISFFVSIVTNILLFFYF